MKKVRFGELFHFIEKSTLKAGEGKKEGKYPFFTSSNIQSKYIDNYQFEGEHLILGTGGSASIHYSKGAFSVSSECLVVKANEKLNLFNPKFVYYFLKGNLPILEAGFKGAGLRHISKAYISNILIQLPSFGEQNRIVILLDKVQNINRSKETIIALIEEFEYSSFQDMFGKIISNDKKWKKQKLGTISTIERGKFTPRPRNDPSFFGGNYPFIQIGDISESGYRLNKWKQTLNEKGIKVSRSFDKGDIVVAIVGATIGGTAILSQKTYTTDSIIGMKVDTKYLTPEYLELLLRIFKPVFTSKIQNADKKNINLQNFKPLEIPVPPLKLQQEFSKLSVKIYNLKNRIINSKEATDKLIESLGHYGFNANSIKINISAFSIDDQVVDYIEAKSEQKDILTAIDKNFSKISELILNEFRAKSFTFLELEKALSEYGIENTYEFPGSEKNKGLKDAVFALLDIKESGKSFLTQIFEIDKNRDTEKKIDESRIAFKLSI